MTPVIEVTGLTARTETSVLVDGIALTVRAGGVTALVGPSGSGKTTTALALLGECEPGVRISGTVRVSGTTVVGGDGVTPQAERVRGGTIAYMPQHPGSALNPARRIGAVLTELARLHRWDGDRSAGRSGRATGATRAAVRAEAVKTLGQAQLPAEPPVLRRFPHEFSGGQRQRVALAQVLACAPRALVLDEPSTGLDTVTRMGLAHELAGLARTGIAILLLSHDHELVRAVADHVVLLEGGRMAGEGPASQLLDRPAPPPEPRQFVVRQSEPRQPDGRDDRASRPAPRLEVRGVTAWLRPGGRDEVLHDAGLTLPPGSCLGIAGRSGSGKTTLARCIAGLHERFRGEVLLDGTALPALGRRSRSQKRRVQYVWQEVRSSFDERRPVLAQVARTAVRLRGLPPAEAEAAAARLLDRLAVAPDTARRRPEGLSGGELQRAALARALVAGPDVLVCDEVTTALDDVAVGRVVAEVTRMRREEGTSVLWIGHDLRLLRRVADRLLVLDEGEVAEEGTTARVTDAPQSEATRLLLAAEDLTTGLAPMAPAVNRPAVNRPAVNRPAVN